MAVDLDDLVAGLVRVLGRRIEIAYRIQVDALAPQRGDLCRLRQSCPICDISLENLLILDDDTTERWLLHQLFAIYDGHRCVTNLVTLEAQ